MERRLVKQGRNALTVTLPSKWLKTKGLEAGNVVNLDVKNQEIVIRTNPSAVSQEVTVDIKDEDKSMMWHRIIAKYVEGYDKITILHNNPGVAQELGQSLIGMIIEEHTNTKTILKSIVSIPETNFDALIRRISHMFLQQAVLLEEVSRGKISPDDVRKQEFLLDSNINYLLRYLNKYENQEHAYRYFLLCSTIELAADNLRIIAQNIGKNAELAEKIRENIELYNKHLFSKDLKNLYISLRKFRKSLNTKSFVEGLTYSLAEILYNNIGYLISE